MDNKEKGPLNFLKKLLSNDNKVSKQGKLPYLVVVILFGAAIMLVSNMLLDKDDQAQEVAAYNEDETSEATEETFGQKTSGNPSSIDEYEEQYKQEIKDAVNAIAGVKDAVVYVNIEGTEKKVYEKNTSQTTQKTEEQDTQGGNRKVEETTNEQSVVLVPSGDKEVPLVVETVKPSIKGVLVVAKGAEDIKIKSMIVEAVTRALDVPSHRVSVQPKQN
ncbi:stage III sporulation protein AG [Bacillus sp. B1-b2]|uniref:stage III sporulation protein AG n=1 Tax=Bacillus sp. B1-b2 TaxID=2653201 RepID=UPI00126208F3|nr:stage III sporulation protein AG [Bacillus sp. B1-b2]KAB7669979.1 stage III sporulation protein AG [Bacillus sp. B1-b2]